MRKKEAARLPDKLSDLILVALKDLRRVERCRGTYTVDMSTYHQPDPDIDKCAVCFAGAVMAGTLGADPKQDVTPSNFSIPIKRRLYALDALRYGGIFEALQNVRIISKRMMKTLRANGLDDGYVSIADYDESPTQFKKDMKKLADRLAKLGL